MQNLPWVASGARKNGQTAGVERQCFALAQEPGVALFAELPCPPRAAGEVVEEGDPALECIGGTRPRGGDEVTVGTGRSSPAEFAEVAGRRPGATGRRARRPAGARDRPTGWPSLFQGPRRVGEPGGRRHRELVLGPKPVEEQTEDALQHRAGVGLWVAPPALPVGQDLASAEHRDGKVAIDPLLLVEVRVGHALEPLPPARGVRVTTAERLPTGRRGGSYRVSPRLLAKTGDASNSSEETVDRVGDGHRSGYERTQQERLRDYGRWSPRRRHPSDSDSAAMSMPR
jgi:hypothetical protein